MSSRYRQPRFCSLEVFDGLSNQPQQFPGLNQLKQLERKCTEIREFSVWRSLFNPGSSWTHLHGYTALCAALDRQEQQR